MKLFAKRLAERVRRRLEGAPRLDVWLRVLPCVPVHFSVTRRPRRVPGLLARQRVYAPAVLMTVGV